MDTVTRDKSKLLLKIIALDRLLYDDYIEQAMIKTTGGMITILKGHMPIAAILEDAPLEVVTSKGEKEVLAVHGGYMTIMDNEVLVVADDALFAHEIDEARVQEDIRRNKELIDGGDADALSLARAEIQLKRSLMNLHIHDMLSKK